MGMQWVYIHVWIILAVARWGLHSSLIGVFGCISVVSFKFNSFCSDIIRSITFSEMTSFAEINIMGKQCCLHIVVGSALPFIIAYIIPISVPLSYLCPWTTIFVQMTHNFWLFFSFCPPDFDSCTCKRSTIGLCLLDDPKSCCSYIHELRGTLASPWFRKSLRPHPSFTSNMSTVTRCRLLSNNWLRQIWKRLPINDVTKF